MKNLLTTFFVLLFLSSSLFSQSKELKEQIDAQYLSLSHKAFIYAVSPQTKAADMRWITWEKQAEKEAIKAPDAPLIPDTSWSFSERKMPTDSMYVPASSTYYFLSGEQGGYYNSTREGFNWNRDTENWDKTTWQKTYYNGSRSDSSISLHYTAGDSIPSSGNKFRYPQTPTGNADYETFRDHYSQYSGWQKDSWTEYYRNEQGYDTLRSEHAYSTQSMDYYKTYEYKNIQSENFNLNSSKSFDLNGDIRKWSYSFSKLIENQQYDYQVSKEYDPIKKMLIGQDSTKFVYKKDHVEARHYNWPDSTWQLSNMYRSYQRTFENPDPDDTYHPTITQVDSVIYYSVYPDSTDENGNIVIDDAISRTEFDYDENGNQIELRNYSLSPQGTGLLVLNSKTEYEYVMIKGTARQSRQTMYKVLNTAANELYVETEYKWVYNENGSFKEYSYTSLDSNGDTTRVNKTVYETFNDELRRTLYYRWDYQDKRLFLRNYKVNYTKRFEELSHYMNQSGTVDYYNNGNRRINTKGRYPIVFNDGPIMAEQGDTLSFYVSGRNIDFSIPSITVTDMPTTATYNPETRKFYWVVDEEDPAPMYYTATNSTGSSKIEVLFTDMASATGVANEKEYTAGSFELKQNYPNPFNPITSIAFNLPKAGEITLTVYNMLGQQVATLVQGKMNAGTQTVQFDASNLASGMYIYRLQTANFVETRKMMLIK